MNKVNYNFVEKILVPHTAMTNALRRVEQCYRASDGSSEPVCVAILGPSRTGKTRVLKHFEKKYPKSRLDDGLRVPILRVLTPSAPTNKGLAEVLLRAIGDPNPGNGNQTGMTSRILTLLQKAETRMLMIDEFQHFYDKKSHKVMHDVANWLKNLVEDSNVALVVSGLASCQAVLNHDEQLAGRFLAPVHMRRFDWMIPDHREEFIAILSSFQEALIQYDMPNLSSDEMAFRFYCASGGLIGYVAKILRQAVWNAVDADSSSISMDNLSTAHLMSVYVDEKAGDLPLSFNREFSLQVSISLLERVAEIGTAVPDELPLRANKNRSPKKSIA